MFGLIVIKIGAGGRNPFVSLRTGSPTRGGSPAPFYNMTTPYDARYFAHELTRIGGESGVHLGGME